MSDQKKKFDWEVLSSTDGNDLWASFVQQTGEWAKKSDLKGAIPESFQGKNDPQLSAISGKLFENAVTLAKEHLHLGFEAGFMIGATSAVTHFASSDFYNSEQMLQWIGQDPQFSDVEIDDKTMEAVMRVTCMAAARIIIGVLTQVVPASASDVVLMRTIWETLPPDTRKEIENTVDGVWKAWKAKQNEGSDD